MGVGAQVFGKIMRLAEPSLQLSDLHFKSICAHLTVKKKKIKSRKFFAWDFPAYSRWEMGETFLLKVANRNRMFLHVRFIFN